MTKEPETPDEKIAWLWNKCDDFNGKLDAMTRQKEQLEEKVAHLKEELLQKQEQLLDMASELNAARMAAATAVQDYIKVAEG